MGDEERSDLSDLRLAFEVHREQLELVLWRLSAIESQRDDEAKWRRQVWTAIFIAILTAVLGLVLPLLSAR